MYARTPILSGQRIVVVGGGVIGTMHAYSALSRGADVIHLERDGRPREATVRNFGLVWVSGRAGGAELDLALRARNLWEEIGGEVPGVHFRGHGSLTVLKNQAELDVAQRALKRPDAVAREFALLSRTEVLALNPGLTGDFEAALWCGRDAAVESRVALGALRDTMTATGRYSYIANTEIVGLEGTQVRDHRGVVYGADRTILCPGASTTGFMADVFSGAPLRKIRLYMLETKASRPLTTAVANGDSFRYYPCFSADAAELLAPQSDLDAHYAIQLLVQQRVHGGLTIGDTHEIEEDGLFETWDDPQRSIEEAARNILGELPAIERRWFGVYHQLQPHITDQMYYRDEIAPGVTVVSGVGGRGMTCAPAVAEESFDDE